MKKLLFVTISLVLISLAACSPSMIENDPAAQDCETNGGQVEIRNENGQSVGYCVFPDGSECSETEYEQGSCDYQSKNNNEEDTSAGLANPASTNCLEQEGTLEIIEDDEGNQYGICTLPNGIRCEEWALFNGMCDPKTGTTITAPADDATQGMAYINNAELILDEGLTVQIMGDLPDSCHRLYIEMSESDDEFDINLNVSSWYRNDPMLACAQALKPFEFNFTIPTEDLTDGTYTVFVNGEEVGAFKFSN